ncbi:uncharacterized protein LOC113531471 isoform X3 [Pangasianodon hypophthalmus]|uniref:uncharacterized protein LOC113531471 isoform X3 n=1 Tax=Pangasianodon hypophthalmus TaxID=310915 RepID=UPI00230743B4|nr:uncharacterized protein LOC113531471 isoform X3 [Pangasianodon hypophthalmus]
MATAGQNCSDQTEAHEHTANQMLKHPLLQHFTLITGNTFGCDVGIEMKLQELIPGLQKVQKVEECDFILVFCPVVPQAGTDIEAAVMKLSTLPGSKPAVLVVLHLTSDPELIVPDSSRAVKRENMITVDCLFHEDQGLLQCSRNNEALSKVINWLNPEVILARTPRKSPTHEHAANQMLKHPLLKHFTLTSGNTFGWDVGIEMKLQELIPGLQKVQKLEECDLILVFCPVVPQAGTDIKAAVKKLSTLPGNKPAVLVVLHLTSDPELTVPDSSRAVNRENMITVDCLFHEDQGLLPCSRNNEALSKVINWLIPEDILERTPRNSPTHEHTSNQMLKHHLLKHFTLTSGNKLGCDVDIERKLQYLIPGLQKVQKVEECDFILVFCPVVSRAGTDIEAAVRKLSTLPGNKPAVLVVLHLTSDPELTVPDSSRAVNRENMITVDCLFHEDQGLLPCSRNNEALSKVINWLIPEDILERTPRKSPTHEHTANQMLKRHLLKHFTLTSGNTLGCDVDIERKLQYLIPGLQKVQKVEECDFILVFCPVVSRAGTDIEAAVRKLSILPGNKPAVLVVLHLTFDPELTVPDSSRAVKRENMITVDCLFHEDQGLLPCSRNNEALSKVINWLIPEGILNKPPRKRPSHEHTSNQMLKHHLLKHFTLTSGNTLGCDVDIERKLQNLIPGLQKVQKVEECDFILVFCPVVSRAGTDIEAAVRKLSILPGNKPAVLVVLHLTSDPELIVPDSSRAVNRENMITVDCLFHEDQGLLPCSRNNEALSKVINWLIPEDILERTPRKSPTHEHTANQMLKHHLLKHFTLTSGNTLGCDVDIERKLQNLIPGLQKVQKVEECDFILVFCPVVSRAGTDIEAAVRKLSTLPGNKPAVLVVLHLTFDPELTVPDSSRAVKRENMITVDCLFHEDQGLLPCSRNNEALSKVINWLIPEDILERTPRNSPTHEHTANQMLKHHLLKHFTLTSGNTLGCDVDIERKLQNLIPGLQKVQKVEECDFILVFCPVVSRAGTDIEAAVRKLSILPGNKPAVLVVLHLTFDPELTVPDSSRAVNRENMITVDCLFHEDQGLLPCSRNNEALSKVINWLNPEGILNKPPRKRPSHEHTANQMLKRHLLKHFTLTSGNTLGCDVDIERKLQYLIPGLQKVQKLEECDFILVFCPVVSRAGIDIEAAVRMLSTLPGNKPAVLVVLHHTFDPELIVPDSSRAVKRENMITVDCLFHEDQGLLQCRKNNEVFTLVSQWIETQILPKTKKGIMSNVDENPKKNDQTNKFSFNSFKLSSNHLGFRSIIPKAWSPVGWIGSKNLTYRKKKT